MLANIAGWLVMIGLALCILGMIVERIVLVVITHEEKKHEQH